MFIFCIWLHNGLFHCGIANMPYLAYSSCICLNFLLSVVQIIMNFLSKISLQSCKVVIHGMKVDDDLIYYWIENQPFPAYSFFYLSNFLSLLSLKNAISHNRFHSNHSSIVAD